jgi:hypothetical protein
LVRLKSVLKAPSPTRPGYTRITGAIDAGKDNFDIWFEVEDPLAPDLSDTANPWLIVMLLFALETGGEIETDLPADPLLLENLYGLIQLWRHWYPDLKPVTIRATPAAPAISPSRTASFFSGGVDAWFTALRHSNIPGIPSVGHVDDFLTVWGFNIRIGDAAEFARMKAMLQPGAAALGKPFIEIATNLRENKSFWMRRWGPIGFAAALAAAALILEKRYKKVLIASGVRLQDLVPYGSHPITNPLFSTSCLTVVLDGSPFSRAEKTALIAKSRIALNELKVCNAVRLSTNCCACEKCYRSMATLEALGMLGQCDSFPKGFSLEALSNIYIGTKMTADFFVEIRALAERHGRKDLVNAIDKSFSRSRLRRPIIDAGKRLQHSRAFWRVNETIKKALLRGMIV